MKLNGYYMILHLFLVSFLKIKFTDNQMTWSFSFDQQINALFLLISLQMTTVASSTPHSHESQHQLVALTN